MLRLFMSAYPISTSISSKHLFTASESYSLSPRRLFLYGIGQFDLPMVVPDIPRRQIEQPCSMPQSLRRQIPQPPPAAGVPSGFFAGRERFFLSVEYKDGKILCTSGSLRKSQRPTAATSS